MNKDKYKATFNELSPSEDAVERIFEMTSDKKKFNHNKIFKRITATALAFVLLIGVGFCADYIAQKNYESSISFPDNKLGVLVACASEKGLVKIENLNEQEFFYRIYVIDYTNDEKRQKVENDYNRENNEQREISEKLSKKDIGTHTNGSFSTLDNGMLRTLNTGNLVLSLNNYSNVKDITIENASKYGELQFSYVTENTGEIFSETENLTVFITTLGEDDAVYASKYICGNKISVTGEELQLSKNIGLYSIGIGKHEINKGYEFSWDISNALYQELEKDINFDLTKITDTITFTVNYLDGTTESTIVNISFDSDGYMHLSNGS
ncbi:MAG: hypothetical protein K2G22_08150 [Eubacterium sp.]|nr:hypothetical protein [Eubacterium sp.]